MSRIFKFSDVTFWIHFAFVAEHFWYSCLLGRAIAGLSYGRFIAIRSEFKLPTYIQEPLVIGRRGYLQRDLNEKTAADNGIG
jgi:hypothetical protein